MISIVICGLVRDLDKAKSKILEFSQMRNTGLVDQVIFSTWIGETSKYPGFDNFLSDNKVELVEVEEPRLVLKGGHQLHQMVSFHYGLAALNNQDQFVLKTRVDLAENSSNMKFDFQQGTPKTRDSLEVGLKHKILIEYAQMAYPFLCGDAQFFGHVQDLKKLINMSNKFEIIYNRLAVEQTFFFKPFSKLRIFQEHFFWNLPHISEAPKSRHAQIQFLINEPTLMEPIYHWWNILDEYFKVGWGDQSNYPMPELADLKGAFEHHSPEKRVNADSSDCISHSSFVKSLSTINPISLEKSAALEKHELERTQVQASRFKALEEFRKEFSDLPSAKGAHIAGQPTTVYGAAQHFFVKDAMDDAASRYHDQVTFLRRENDQLKKLLNVGSSTTSFHSVISKLIKPETIIRLRMKYPKIAMFYGKYFMTKLNKHEQN